MAETAVGLFEDASIAEAVVDSLRAHGFPSNGIRVVAAPHGTMNGSNGAGSNGSKSDGAGDFITLFSKDQRAIGVPEAASSAYLSALRQGNALVYATGTRQQATEAVTIMDEFAAIEIEAIAGSAPSGARSGGFRSDGKTPVTGSSDLGTINPEGRLPESQVTIGEHEHSYTTHASRAKKEGARVFSW
jgi:hypothetical protein